MKGRGISLVEVLVVLLILIVLFLIFMPVGGYPKHAAQATHCLSNIKQVGTGLVLYQTDYDDWNPPAAAWASSVKPYIKSSSVFVCPSFRTPYGYALNDDAEGKKAKLEKDKARAVMLFESTKGVANAHDRIASLPIPGRHSGKNAICYLDGHAKRVQTVTP